MNCLACGNASSDGSLFCEFCGAAHGPISPVAIAGPSMAAATVVQPPHPPTAAAIAELGGMLIKSLSLGEKLAGAGSLAATIGFFLPLMSAPDLRSLGNVSTLLGASGMGTASYSGLDLAKLWGGFYLVLAAAISSGVLFFISGKATFSKKLMTSGFQVLIGALYGPGLLFGLLFVPFAQSVAGSGIWFIALGFCSIAAGGLVTIGQLGGMLRSGHS